jgi:hypothetical protein
MAGRVTQEGFEVLTQPSPYGRVTQLLGELLIGPTTSRGRVSQTVVETLVLSSTSRARITQTVVEVLIKR